MIDDLPMETYYVVERLTPLGRWRPIDDDETLYFRTKTEAKAFKAWLYNCGDRFQTRVATYNTFGPAPMTHAERHERWWQRFKRIYNL